MKRIALAFAALSSLAAGAAFTNAAFADDDDDHDRARRAVLAGEVRPLEEIVAKAKTDFGGDLIGTELEEKHGALVYDIKLLDKNGRVMKLVYDARDGRLLKAKSKKDDD